MAVWLREVYRETQRQFQLKLLAGEAGLDHILKWVYVAEDHTTTDFLRGGELIITTGVLSRGDPHWLLRFLERIHGEGTCGVILNVGRYLWEADVTQEVLAFCNDNAFPLFTMPWHIHIYDITREYYSRIFQDSRRSEHLSQAIRTMANGGPGQEEAMALLEENHFPAKAPYCLAGLWFAAGQETSLPDNERVMNRVLAMLAPLPCYLAVSGSCLLLCRTDDPAMAEDIASRLHQLITEMLPALTLRIGVSDRLDGLADLPKGLFQAQTAAELHPEQAVSFYGNLGFFKILSMVTDTSLLENFVHEQLAAVHAYDEKHRTDFARTLRLYLELDHSVQRVAERSFCHRNTVSHRLQLLRDMGYRLEEPNVCFSLLAAFQTEDYLQLRRG